MKIKHKIVNCETLLENIVKTELIISRQRENKVALMHPVCYAEKLPSTKGVIFHQHVYNLHFTIRVPSTDQNKLNCSV